MLLPKKLLRTSHSFTKGVPLIQVLSRQSQSLSSVLFRAYTVERLVLTHCGLFNLLGIRVRGGKADTS
jgi:hypothetical protein